MPYRTATSRINHDGKFRLLYNVTTELKEVNPQDMSLLRREPHRHLRKIALTGYGQPGDRQRELHIGFSDHLIKPVGIDALEGAITGLAARLCSPSTVPGDLNKKVQHVTGNGVALDS